MRKIDSMLSEQKKKLLRRVNMSAQHQEVLHIFPRMTADPVESGDVKVHLGGEGYNRKTLNQVKRSIPKQQTDNIEQAAEDPGQEEVVQQCMANQSWLESLFSSFMELLTLSAKT
ncbi:proline-rich protein 12-like isoform X2 [Oreochromis aureus]|uniref:proline-rich protein 12-like isoform X2 n=1 Tax=Oreochromis aureus TaxID=47969 RepID=UPI001952ACFD|nr:proline-rich protein 12-like isoform X2 [Oreochromis aureus]